MNTQENNKLIAEFMGYQVVDNPRVINGENFFQYIDKENKKYTYMKSLLRYNDSWDWLMPVVEKIYRDRGLDDEIILMIRNSIAELNIESMYKAVVEFIKQYNK